MIGRPIAIAFCALFSMTLLGTPLAAKDMPASGLASVYGFKGDKHASGSKTASGERVQPGALTAAHRTLPFGTKVRVTNKRNGKTVVVRINDRGPFKQGRVIDLTPSAASALGFSGLVPVTISVVKKPATYKVANN